MSNKKGIFELIEAVFDSDLDKKEKLILLAFLSFANQDGTNMHPGQSRIAWMCDYYSKHEIKDTIHNLEKDFILQPGLKRSGRGTKIYSFHEKRLPGRKPYKGVG
mgnify:CR=1 FL=1